MKAQPGDEVEVKTDSEVLKGRLMPKKPGHLVLKLDSGYNIGIEEKKIKNIKVIKQYSEKKKESQKMQTDNKLPTISILHTGGTIASEVDYTTGAVFPKFTPEEILEKFPELKNIANINSRLIGNMFSEDLRFAHYNIIAKEVEKELKAGAKGIIVTHGTDTMHYTSAALAFMLKNISIPVLIVGAQRSSDRGSSDAFLNLASASMFIAKSGFKGVGICMHENIEDKNCLILPAFNTRKMHTSRRDAFKTVNRTAIARVNYDKNNIEMLQKIKDAREIFELRLFKEDLKIGIVRSHPNMFAEELKHYDKFDGLIIEGTGIGGHFPINKTDNHNKEHEKIFHELEKLAKKIPVIATSQCIFGRINMNVYSGARKLQEISVKGNMHDMTTETAFIKLAFLLSNNKKEAKNLIDKNIAGEITERSQENEFDSDFS